MFIPSNNSFTASELIVLADAGLMARPDAPARTAAALWTDPARDGRLSGILAGGLVETAFGWQPVETLLRGMRVGTWDGGFAVVEQVLLHEVRLVPGQGLIHVPGGALGNCGDLTLLPAQTVLIESAVAEAVLDAAAVLVPASALAGWRGITRIAAPETVTVVSLVFAQEEVVFVNSGALLHCRAAGSAAGTESFFQHLTIPQARALIELTEMGTFCPAAPALHALAA